MFNRVDVSSLIEMQSEHVKNCVRKIEPNELLNRSTQDLIDELVQGLRLAVPVLLENLIYVADQHETEVDVSRDPLRFAWPDEGPIYAPGTRVVIAVPFEGDPALFDVRPRTFTTTLPTGLIIGHEVHMEFTRTDHDNEALKVAYERQVAEIKAHLQWLESSVAEFNSNLQVRVSEAVSRRREKLLADNGLVAALGLPIRKRDGAPTSYALPVQRAATPVRSTAGPFQPEPTLALKEYEHILSILRNMVLVMERSPRAFCNMGEEDIRTHFLVQLNGQYESQATGETFNYQGKTDILIRSGDRNAFIAECKIWKGEKQLLEAIDQLLGYLCWRDTKTALLVFNRNADFSGVLSTISEAVRKHPALKRMLPTSAETEFSYVFHQPDDVDREVYLTVMAFDIPSTAQGRVTG